MTNTNEARIETSTVCNYSCSFCPHSDLARPVTLMDIDLFKRIIDNLPYQIDTVTLSGLGEMFLHLRIFDMIAYAKKKGYTVNALTNASMFTPDRTTQLIHSGIDSIRISIHAASFDKYSKITGTSSQTSFLNKEYLIDALRDTPIQVIVTMDVTDYNADEVDAVIHKYEHRVDLLEIWKVHNWGKWGKYRQGEKAKMTCGRPFNGPLQIQVDGTVNMCCFDYDGKLLLGDLTKQKLTEVFDSKMFHTIQAFHNGADVNEDLLCKHCDQLYAKDESILIYNSKYGGERIGTLSTTYKKMEGK